MRLSDSVDLNLVSHGHGMHAHGQLSARSDKTCENTPRFTPRLTPRVCGASSGPRPQALVSLTIQLASAVPAAATLSEEEIRDLCDLVSDGDASAVFGASVPVLSQVPSSVTEEYLSAWSQYDCAEACSSSSEGTDACLLSSDLTEDEDEFYFLSDSEDSLEEESWAGAAAGRSLHGSYPCKASPRTRSGVYSSLGLGARGNRSRSYTPATSCAKSKSKRGLESDAHCTHKRHKSNPLVDEWDTDAGFDDFCY